MKNIRIYQPGSYQPGETIELSASAGQHVGVVLRMKVGEKLTLFCGDSHEYEAAIVTIHKKRVAVTIENKHLVNRESPKALHLAQSISKGERMELVIQKAVELGVASITPIISERTVVRLDEERLIKKQAQWQAIAISACEQSGRNTIPVINPPIKLDAFLRTCQADLKLMLSPLEAKSWRDYDLSGQDATLLIGPEGGFSQDEIELAKAHHFRALRMGPRILRTETAAICALSILQAVAGDL